MARKEQDEHRGERSSAEKLAETVKASAQQIWLAGLGALSKAQEEGGKVFEALVKEGATLQQRTQEAAGEKFGDASARMSSMAGELSSRATDQWDRLEQLLEERVARAVRGLGLPGKGELDALAARVGELERQVARLQGGGRSPARPAGASKAAQARAAKAPAGSPARKRAPGRKSGTPGQRGS